MSEVSAPREWRFYVEDMVVFCDRVLDYTRDLDRASFASEAMRHDAILRNLELVGEAARPMCRPTFGRWRPPRRGA
ncbi:MAG: DUF86 domain-containing protein [Burkholderiales bacterium]|nr:DUF86 domain-containing protein [Burkholderiales bacterium]MDE2626103.1 DUF86 domain-containing protein [Burkholderiales bacterium]